MTDNLLKIWLCCVKYIDFILHNQYYVVKEWLLWTKHLSKWKSVLECSMSAKKNTYQVNYRWLGFGHVLNVWNIPSTILAKHIFTDNDHKTMEYQLLSIISATFMTFILFLFHMVTCLNDLLISSLFRKYIGRTT